MHVIDEGFENEIHWQEKINIEDVDECYFLKELAWVILSTSMREFVIRSLFSRISFCFYNWKSANIISKNSKKCYENSIKIFNHKGKINSIVSAAKRIDNYGFKKIFSQIKKDPIKYLQTFSYIGPTTTYHLAKNIGFEVAKPDRHLKRIAELEGFNDVQLFCKEISKLSKDSIPVVDIVIWRFASIEPNYLTILSNLNLN